MVTNHSDPSEAIQGTLEPPLMVVCHGKWKGPMTSQPSDASPLTPPLVKDKDFAVGRAQSFIGDANLNEDSKHETDDLTDVGLHDLTKVGICTFLVCVKSWFLVIIYILLF